MVFVLLRDGRVMDVEYHCPGEGKLLPFEESYDARTNYADLPPHMKEQEQT